MDDFNKWRATAHAYYGSQHLLYIGANPEQIKKNYMSSFYELLQVNEQVAINKITLEKWKGSATKGYWNPIDFLRVPKINNKKFDN